MAIEVSRRSFLKGSAALALATAASGLLAGCGSASSSATSVDVGAFRVDVTNAKISYDISGTTISVTPTVKFTSIGNGTLDAKYSKLFSAAVGSDSTDTIAPDNGSKSIYVSSGLFGNSDTATPTFTLTKAQQESMDGGEPFVLTVKIYNNKNTLQTAQFCIYANGKVTSKKS